MDDWKLRTTSRGELQLFAAGDSEELNDHALQQAELIARLQALEPDFTHLGDLLPHARISDAEMEELQALGYAD